jgi:transglutaminase-like putative cysteine protease
LRLRVGFEMSYQCPQPTPMILSLNIHYSRSPDLESPDYLRTEPSTNLIPYRDGFGNWCTRLIAPAGLMRITADAIVRDHGLPDPVVPGAQQHAVETLPDDTLVFLLASRYCDTENLAAFAWQNFGGAMSGWERVQSICDFVNRHITFGYQFARATRTASEAFAERQGVCRDYAHLAVALCRCLNIPARYCTGYLGDIRIPPVDAPMDFAGWFEAYIGGQWYTFDARNNTPRIGRVLMARGRDAADVALAMTFGPNELQDFRVWAYEVPG